FDAGFKKYLDGIPQELALVVNLNNPVERRDGRVITRQKATQLDVALDDPRRLIALDRAVLRWRALGTGPDGDWQEVPFTTGRAVIDLTGYRWTRGPHRFEFALFRNRGAAFPEIQPVAVFEYIPAAPVATV